jgi:F420-0:gamma-glutamyl ligase
VRVVKVERVLEFDKLLGLVRERLKKLNQEDLVAIARGVIKLCSNEKELCEKIKLIGTVLIKACEEIEKG